MLIKLNVEGKLLECLQQDAKANCRTNPQQVLFYLQQIYKGELSVPNGVQLVPSCTNESTEKVQDKTIVSTKEESTNAYDIPDDILNF